MNLKSDIMRKLFTFLITALVFIVNTYAQEAKQEPILIDGVYYKFGSTFAEIQYSDKHQSNINEESRKIIIPEYIYYDGSLRRVIRIWNYAFSQNYNVSYISLPNTITMIPVNAFPSSKLESIDLPNSIKSIGYQAFLGCWDLKSLVLPDSLERIGGSSFLHCGIESVVIPNRVTSIGARAFSSCWRLSHVTIPSGVKKIGKDAFDGCSGLTYIKCLATEPPEISWIMRPSDIPIYVPAESVEKYKAAEGWKDYNIQPIEQLIVLATYTYQNPTPDSERTNTTCYMEFMGTERDSDNVEELILNFIEMKNGYIADASKKSRPIRYQYYNTIYPQYLMKTKFYYTLPDGRNILYNIGYSVHGSGVKFNRSGTYVDTGEACAISTDMKKHAIMSKIITEKFYTDLKDILQNDIGYKTEYDYKLLTWEEYRKDSAKLERKVIIKQ